MNAAWQPRALGISKRAGDDVYIPHPAPSSMLAGDEDTVNMGFFSVVKTLVIPAIISLFLYLVISYIVVPIWKRYKGRYSQYLPLDTISTQTSSIRRRILDAIARWVLPSAWRSQFNRDQYAVSAQDGSGSDFDEEDGEELYEVDENRREALSLDARRGRDDDGRRLSRDLEEGFKDDSDEEDDERQGRTSSR
ncbi:hypothetical protein ONS95_012984 [Cadophora gregata]|uniref:uncharacterized protein n=1 Tax=Cadophora gregata TaxID=51156 RepID=UPI0026DC7F72|nr:uncharacterized protein ONS95_012984 [Cadophora gregata]KAK0101029.1 hypothetical protein ONS96_006259 [Cadophora gregata f. sp. sojae]KAK0115942.1 hypothetical protein ONS95_012984 [Cadophora gregata]